MAKLAKVHAKAAKGADPDLKDVIDSSRNDGPDTSAADKELEALEKKRGKRKKKRK